MKKLMICLVGLVFVFLGVHEAQASKKKTVQPEPVAESLPAIPEPPPPPMGSVSFFLNPKDNPESQPGSVHVGESDRVYFCMKLNPQDARLGRMLRYLRGVGLTLEGGGENPQRISGVTRFRKRPLEPEANGCFLGRLQIPFGIPPGKYKVSEIDLWEAPSNSVSLREELKEFSPLGVVEIDSPQVDREPPIIERIVTRTPTVNHLNFGGHIGSATMLFRVVATDLISGVKPESLKVFFRAYLDGLLVDILEPKCRTRFDNLYYDCRLRFSRAQPDLRAVTAKFVIDSISVADHLGNDIEINDPEKLKSLYNGDRLVYTFYPTRSLEKKAKTSEKKEEDLVEWPPVVSPPVEYEAEEF